MIDKHSFPEKDLTSYYHGEKGGIPPECHEDLEDWLFVLRGSRDMDLIKSMPEYQANPTDSPDHEHSLNVEGKFAIMFNFEPNAGYFSDIVFRK